MISTTAVAAPSFGKPLAPPKVFDGIRAGMALADAERALSGFQPDASYQDGASRKRFVKDAGDGAKYYVLIKGDVVSRIGVEAPERGLEARLAKLWGAPERATNLANESIVTWKGAGWRADVSCRNSLCRLAFHEPLTSAFFGGAVSPPGVLATLQPGSSRDDIHKLSPRHLSDDVPAGPEDVRVTLDLERTGHLRSVLIGGLPANARDLLESAWGAPLATDRGPVWFNADLGWRAVYDHDLQSIQISGYLPATRFLGPGPGIAALAKPILGATRDQIAAAYPEVRADHKTATLVLPPMEGGIGIVTASFDPKTSRVMRVSIQLPFDTTARRDELVKLMAAKWGAPKQTKGGLAYPTGKIRIEVSETKSMLELRLGL